MALDGTYETKLLRLLIGYAHISVLQQIALTRHGKAFHALSQEERDALELEVVETVMRVANHVSDEALSTTPKPPIMH